MRLGRLGLEALFSRRFLCERTDFVSCVEGWDRKELTIKTKVGNSNGIEVQY